MNRTIGFERLYKVADFANIKTIDTYAEIPEEVALNPDAIKKIRDLMMIESEAFFRTYLQLKGEFDKLPNDKAIEKLNALKELKFSELTKLLKGEK